MGTYSKRGFSLVELLVVISIIAVISAITLPNFMGARDRSRDAQRIADMQAVKNALRMYYNDNQSYPVGAGVTLGVGLTGYMPSILNLGYTYGYYQTRRGEGFELCLNLESGQGDEDIYSQQKCGIGTTTVCGIGSTRNALYVVCAN